jgi:hypothetical protein
MYENGTLGMATTEVSQLKRDPYRETVNRIYNYLDGLPGGARQAWQEAAYQSYLADRLERKA